MGASEEEIVFPDTLNVTVSVSDTQEESDTTDNEESVSGNTDTVSGNAVVLGEDVETPVIYVLIGESDHVSAIAEEGYTEEGFCEGYSWVDGSLVKNSGEGENTCSHGDTCNGYQPSEETAYDVDGNDTIADNEKAYKITNAGQLYWFAAYVNQGGDNLKANAYLANDITINANLLSNIQTDEEGNITNDGVFRKWVPIGDWDTNEDLIYAGVFDGKECSIKGMYINETSKTNQGLLVVISKQE